MMRVTTKKAVLMGVFFVASFSHTQSRLHCIVGDREYPSGSQVKALIEKNRKYLYKTCSSLYICFRFWHDGEYSVSLWNAFAHEFLDFSFWSTQQNWEKLGLGERLDALFSYAGKGHGIEVEVHVKDNFKDKISFCLEYFCQNSCICKPSCCCIGSCDTNAPCSCKTFVSKKDKKVIYHDEEIWKKVVAAYVDFLRRMLAKSEYARFLKNAFPALKHVLDIDKSSGIHGVIIMGVAGVDKQNTDFAITYGLQESDNKEFLKAVDA